MIEKARSVLTNIATPRLVVFPKYAPNKQNSTEPLSKAQAFLKMAGNSFNYNVLGDVGFDVLASLMDRVQCFQFSYPSLDEALSGIDRLWHAG